MRIKEKYNLNEFKICQNSIGEYLEVEYKGRIVFTSTSKYGIEDFLQWLEHDEILYKGQPVALIDGDGLWWIVDIIKWRNGHNSYGIVDFRGNVKCVYEYELTLNTDQLIVELAEKEKE